VLLPAYNAGGYLRPAVDSILRQSFTNIELLIIDDGSTDDSFSTLQDIDDPRVIIFHQKNSGKAVALNRALDILKGQFWLIQDADDLSYPNRIEWLLQKFNEHPELSAVFSGHDLLMGTTRFAPTCSSLTTNQCRNEILNFRIPAHDATGMYRTSSIQKQKFDPALRIGQGVDFILRTGESHLICRIGRCLYTYRINFQSSIRKQPSNNNHWINSVMQKACARRGIDYTQENHSQPTTKSSTQTQSHLNHIVSHCMDSVVDLKQLRHLIKAIQTGLICARISPLELSFYKPLIYSLLPIQLIMEYRKRKFESR
jgi:glycosyltransferase involved in cell wall biosynthesis